METAGCVISLIFREFMAIAKMGMYFTIADIYAILTSWYDESE